MDQPVRNADELPKGFIPLQSENGKVVYAACMDANARHYKWLMWKHPDGQWVSKRKLEDWEVMQAEDQAHYGIVLEPTPEPKQPALDDPCPGCRKGGVCRTPKCGRLKLPVDHPLRNQEPVGSLILGGIVDTSSGPEYEEWDVEWNNKAVEALQERLVTGDAVTLPLYTRPVREWVGLTDEERREIFDACDPTERGYVLAMTEAKLKEKNA